MGKPPSHLGTGCSIPLAVSFYLGGGMPLDWKGLLFGLVPLLAGIGITANVVTSMRDASAEAREAAAWPEAAGRVTRT